MHRPKYISLSFAFFLLLPLAIVMVPGCETISEIDLPLEKPKLVVNAIFDADSLVNVNLTESKAVNSGSQKFKAVENASIEIFQKSVSLGYLQYKGEGNYVSAVKLPFTTNTSYALKVRAAGFDMTEATEIIPDKPEVAPVIITRDLTSSNTAYKYNAKFKLTDAPADNFYFLRIWIIQPGRARYPLYFRLNNEFGQFTPQGAQGPEIVLFDDKSFNGKQVTFDVSLTEFFSGVNNDIKILVELSGTPKSYYDFHYSVKKQVSVDPLFGSTDAPVISNIKNGLGIFAPYNSATLYFDVPR
jgi:hypothetical protein